MINWILIAGAPQQNDQQDKQQRTGLITT